MTHTTSPSSNATPLPPKPVVVAPPQSLGPKTDFTDVQAQAILVHTRGAVEAAVDNQPHLGSLRPDLATAVAFGLFVSLRRPTQLRACRGRWGTPHKPLETLLNQVARDTATLDSRFPSITAQELPYLAVEVSIMYEPVQVHATGEDRITAVEVGRHGLVIDHPRGRGLLLPHVATEAGWDAKTFLDHLAIKAGLPPDTWRRDPTAQLMTFCTKLFVSEPLKQELDIQSLQAVRLHRLLATANLLLQDRPLSSSTVLSDMLTQSNEQELGIHLQAESGSTATATGSGHSLMELTRAAVDSLKDRFKNLEQTQPSPIKRITILWQPIRLRPEDHPDRHQLLSQSAVRIRCGDQWRLVLPEHPGPRDMVGQALASMQMTGHGWKGTAQLTAFAVLHFESRERPGGPNLRQAAHHGRFYPADAPAMNRAIDTYLANRSPNNTRKHCRAVMLPHAGWVFCGHTIGKTLAGIHVPQTVIILGPKHTPFGAQWSVPPHDHWNIPGATIPIATRWAQELVERVPELVCEPEAHRTEHASEVLLPFLSRLQPNLEVVPVVMGQTSYESTAAMAQGLAWLINKMESDPLLVISSDLNHFATEPENRRLDQMAINAMLTGDPRTLWDACQNNQISMCGLSGAVAVMRALAKTKPLELELIDYRNSAAASGDTSRVVGYAGVHIG